MRSCSCSWSAPFSLWRCFGVSTGSISDPPPHEEEPSAAHSTVCSSPLPRRLPCLLSRLPCRVEWRASACFCATLARGQKPAGSTQTGEHRGLCLSQPAVRLLRDHRCPSPRDFLGMARMAVPNGSRPFAVRPAAPPSVRDATPRCTG